MDINRFIWQLGYKPLKEKKDESIITIIKKSIRTRKSRKLEAEIENIMFELKLINNSGEYAMHLNTNKKSENHFITVWKFPRGLEFKDYKRYESVFSDNLIAQVIMSKHNGKLVIEIVKGVIPTKIKYKFNINDYIENNYIIPVPLGYDQSGLRLWDLTEVYHIIISGVIGGGKSNTMRVMLDAVLQNNDVLVFVIDFAEVDFFESRNNVIFSSDLDETENIINYLIEVNIKRRNFLADNGYVNILKYNESNSENKMKYMILFIDEAAFTSQEMSTDKNTKKRLKNIQNKLIQIISTSRKTGIIFILGLQRPEKDIMPMLIKSQIPGKIAFKTENTGTSRTIIGCDDAFYLPNIKGRMLAVYGSTKLEIQSMFLDDKLAKERYKNLPIRKDKEYVTKNEYEEKRLLPR